MRFYTNEERELWNRAGFTFIERYEEDQVALDIDPINYPVPIIECPCARGHYLHSNKEPLVNFKGQIWAWGCAIQNVLIRVTEVISELMDRHPSEELRDRVLNLEYQLKKVIDLKENMKKTFIEWIDHKEGCRAINPAVAMREDTEEIKCTCGKDQLAIKF